MRFSAEILGRRRFGERDNSKALAVISLFPAVFLRKLSLRELGTGI
jgi:hypothetical protein